MSWQFFILSIWSQKEKYFSTLALCFQKGLGSGYVILLKSAAHTDMYNYDPDLQNTACSQPLICLGVLILFHCHFNNTCEYIDQDGQG